MATGLKLQQSKHLLQDYMKRYGSKRVHPSRRRVCEPFGIASKQRTEKTPSWNLYKVEKAESNCFYMETGLRL